MGSSWVGVYLLNAQNRRKLKYDQALTGDV